MDLSDKMDFTQPDFAPVFHPPSKSPVSATTTVCSLSWSKHDVILAIFAAGSDILTEVHANLFDTKTQKYVTARLMTRKQRDGADSVPPPSVKMPNYNAILRTWKFVNTQKCFLVKLCVFSLFWPLAALITEWKKGKRRRDVVSPNLFCKNFVSFPRTACLHERYSSKRSNVWARRHFQHVILNLEKGWIRIEVGRIKICVIFSSSNFLIQTGR